MRAAPPPETNFACPDCKYYQVSIATVCRCGNDTAWAFPSAAALAKLNPSISGEQKLDPSTGYPNGVFWTPRFDNAGSGSNAWGGWFRITPAPHLDLSQVYYFDVCAGCAQNRVGAGAIVGRIAFQITNTGGKTSVSTFLQPSGAPGAKVTSTTLHMFQSFIAPGGSMAPGQFQKMTEISAVSVPFSYGTSWSVTKVITGPVKVQGTDYTVPDNERNTTSIGVPTNAGLFVAIHLSVGGSYCPA
ncbi:hypothetical protein HYH02_002535 [Chlamydomonas schloesseri]|uniref:Uncharacterized protein n=1 Tax=Chlamydomonas schloesseri TaxID=2026947 RepID=A0A835WTL0_9CHLO|nr:hypothetical protein HYH02_002535 [Chlamydomonas schloesseri]|eukprot:KAG2453212.1 hypothetical protein HYH02_002535 [Chlamydomonas schloesseri]